MAENARRDPIREVLDDLAADTERARERVEDARQLAEEAQGINTRTLENVSQDHGGAGLHRALGERLRLHALGWI